MRISRVFDVIYLLGAIQGAFVFALLWLRKSNRQANHHPLLTGILRYMRMSRRISMRETGRRVGCSDSGRGLVTKWPPLKNRAEDPHWVGNLCKSRRTFRQ